MNKYAHVRASKIDPENPRICAWPTCRVAIASAHLMCEEHWVTLHPDLRRAVWDAYEVGQEETGLVSREYAQAVEKALAYAQVVIGIAALGE